MYRLRFLDLLLEVWSQEVFKEIWNTIRTFTNLDMSFIEKGILTIGRTLIGLDLREGLTEEILTQCGSHSYT
jgi:hypothetical protein